MIRDAYAGIGDHKTNSAFSGLSRLKGMGFDRHKSRIGEFDGIADKVEKNFFSRLLMAITPKVCLHQAGALVRSYNSLVWSAFRHPGERLHKCLQYMVLGNFGVARCTVTLRGLMLIAQQHFENIRKAGSYFCNFFPVFFLRHNIYGLSRACRGALVIYYCKRHSVLSQSSKRVL